VKQYKYIGCFMDKSRRDLPLQAAYNYMTPEICYHKCRDKGFPYFGLQGYYYCYCGYKYGAYGKRPEGECSYNCSGDKSKKCGGSWRNSVYSTGLKCELWNSEMKVGFVELFLHRMGLTPSGNCFESVLTRHLKLLADQRYLY
jgi:hypothetical protein